jgi:1-aminocyclopropane-1-carboxylate deaminase/D-cysteine desulfhydrase-like pyridoxal-dependent ACC family enzyme
MRCILVLAGSPPASVNGNVLLDILLGAELVWSGERDRMVCFEETLQQAERQGRRPYRIPYGGSSPLGAAAYAQALAEFLQQGVPADRLVLASSSGGTQAGLVAGARLFGFRGRITGISVDQPADGLRETVAELATRTAALLGERLSIHPGEIDVDDGFLGEGYGVMSDLERQAIRAFAADEGLLLDPVYTGRAAGGMLARIREGRIGRDERVLFWHTGGTPALFAYAAGLQSY